MREIGMLCIIREAVEQWETPETEEKEQTNKKTEKQQQCEAGNIGPRQAEAVAAHSTWAQLSEPSIFGPFCTYSIDACGRNEHQRTHYNGYDVVVFKCMGRTTHEHMHWMCDAVCILFWNIRTAYFSCPGISLPFSHTFVSTHVVYICIFSSMEGTELLVCVVVKWICRWIYKHIGSMHWWCMAKRIRRTFWISDDDDDDEWWWWC